MNKTYYSNNRARILRVTAEYRAKNREEINKSQRERYANVPEYREYMAHYQREYRRLYC